MAQVEGLNLRGSRYYVRIIIPEDLWDVYGKHRVNPALGTSDRHEATLLATLKRAEWLADFEAKRVARNPSAVAAIAPELAALLADMVRVHVLAEDDRVRSDVALLAEMVHVRRELALRETQPLRIPQWAPSEVREDDLSGLTADEARELATLNAYLDGNAAMAIDYAEARGYVYDKEPAFLRDTVRARKLSSAQKEWKAKINRRILAQTVVQRRTVR